MFKELGFWCLAVIASPFLLAYCLILAMICIFVGYDFTADYKKEAKNAYCKRG